MFVMIMMMFVSMVIIMIIFFIIFVVFARALTVALASIVFRIFPFFFFEHIYNSHLQFNLIFAGESPFVL
jgi:hypothetical protein